MRILEGLEPRKVFYYFEEICKIPHGSGNVEQISNYLADFAEKRNLFYKQDDLKNVVIVKDATPGYEDAEPVILQGHMDMVAVKNEGYAKNMETDGLDIKISGDTVFAEGTSLGGDDGIAVAYALAILDDDMLKHPKLEVVITVDEEVGMDGARGIDLSYLTGKRMLNLDSEEEGIFLTSCAGGARVNTTLNLKTENKAGIGWHICVEGLLGGHSGSEIHKGRGNANCIMGRVLYKLADNLPLFVKQIEGGLADNAIPRQAAAEVLVEEGYEEQFKEILTELKESIKVELNKKDPDFKITAVSGGEETSVCTNQEESIRLASYLISLPNGVMGMSADIEGLVETSLNLGILGFDAEDGALTCEFSVRSSVESAKEALCSRLFAITALAGGKAAISGDYPGWAYRADSPLRECMVTLYEEMYGKKPELTAIHAGLECGLLAGKIKGLDCISFGPDMQNIHTTEETLSISSVKRVWEYIVRLLEILR